MKIVVMYIVVMILSPFLGHSPSTQSVTAVFAAKPPTIDGVTNETQWATADPVAIQFTSSAAVYDASIGVLNNEDHLFLYIHIFNATYNASSENEWAVRLDFHYNNTGTNDSFADSKKIETWAGYRDWYRNTTTTRTDSHQDGEGKWSHDPGEGYGNYTFEFGIPLSSGDPLDLNATIDDALKFQLFLLNGNQTRKTLHGTWPQYGEQDAAFADLSLAKYSEPTSEKSDSEPLGPVEPLILFGSLITTMGILASKRRKISQTETFGE
ncbi:MAG: hypothetical protein ACFFB3_10510 [Candidatus Hodarchaeota archaeon]